MQVIKNDKSLGEAIRQLESQQKAELDLLRIHFEYTVDSLNPVNIIKEKFHDTVGDIGDSIKSAGFKNNALKIGVGLASGFLTKKLFIGSSGGIIKKILGTVVQAAVSGFVMKKLPKIEDEDPRHH